MDNLLYIRTTLDKDSLCKNLRTKLFEDDSLLIQQVDFSDTTKIQGFLPLSFWSWFTQSKNKSENNMKTEDLMIGDWVCLEDENLPLEERYFKIEYLAISSGASWANQGTNAPIGLGDGKSLIPVFKDEIKPIPLTPEILEKNDILYEKQSFYYVIEDDKDLECTYYIQQVLQGDWVVGVDIGAYDCSVFARIKYVHELQHALKLCGIEKEIII